MPGRMPVLTVWPKVIGIISLVLGGLGVLANCWGVAMMVFMGQFMGQFMKFVPQPSATVTTTAPDGSTTTTTTVTSGPDAFQGMQQIMAKWQGGLAAAAVLQLLAAGLLVFAGAMLVQRKRSGTTLHLAYAGVRALSVVVAGVVNYFYTQDIMASVAQQSGSQGGAPAAMMSTFMQSMGIVGVVVGLVWGIAYPAFLAFWFSRAEVRHETVEWK